jgi:hypothetical protein
LQKPKTARRCFLPARIAKRRIKTRFDPFGSESMPSWTKKVTSVAALAALTVSLPGEANAFGFRWLRDRCCGTTAARTAYYAPAAVGTCQPSCCCQAPPPVAACPAPCPQQVCSYQPQTCYRTVFQQVPVTVYRPVTTVDPCTGCPQTTMQACTTMTTQAQRVPYTTYRQVCQMVQPQPTCNTCAMPVVSGPQVVQMPPPPMMQQQLAMPVAPATPGCSSCGVGQVVAPAAPMVPSYPQYQQAPQQFQQPTTELAPQQPSSSLTPVPADQAPTLQQGQSYYQGPTFPSNNSTTQYPQTQYPQTQYPATTSYPPVTSVPSTSGNALYPVPTTTLTPSTGTSYQPRVPAAPPAIRPLPDPDRVEPAAPGLLNPQDRTAARPLPTVGAIAPISWETSAQVAAAKPAVAVQPASPAKKWDASGWAPAR